MIFNALHLASTFVIVKEHLTYKMGTFEKTFIRFLFCVDGQ